MLIQQTLPVVTSYGVHDSSLDILVAHDADSWLGITA